MANKILNLIIKATDKASPTLDKLSGAKGQGGIGGITASLKGLINPATMAMGAIAGLGAAVVASINEWREYVLGVADFNAMIHGTIEETTVLMQLSKDYNITMDTMLAAMRSLASSGIEPNIEGLIQLRAQLDNTSSASERLALAQRLIGEQGIKQILPMLEQLTNEELRDYIDTMEEGNIVTNEQVIAAREMELALSNLDDMWKSYTRGLVMETVPVLNDLLYVMQAIGEVDIGGWFADMSVHTQAATWFWEQFKEVVGDVRAVIELFDDEIEKEHIVLVGEVALVHENVRLALIEEGKALDTLSIKQLEQLAAEAVLAGNFVLADSIMNKIRLFNTEAEAIQAVIDLLYELDGTSVYYSAYGAWSGGPSGPGVTPRPGVSTGGGVTGGDTVRGWQVFPWSDEADMEYYRTHPKPGFAFGGSFEVGGTGGPDSQRIAMNLTPGEIVNVSKEDSIGELAQELRRLVNNLPTLMRDAVERAI